MLTTKYFYADEVEALVMQVNSFLATLPKTLVKDVQFHLAKICLIGKTEVFAAWIVYEVQP